MIFFDILLRLFFCVAFAPREILSQEPTLIPTHSPTKSKIFSLPTVIPTARPTVCAQFSSSDLAVLKEFYESTDGENWHYDELTRTGAPWNFSQPDPNPCKENWAFIICEQCSLYALLILEGDLVGTIPESIGQLDLSVRHSHNLYQTAIVGIQPNLLYFIAITINTF
jgi:hypothetical protein